VCANPPVLFQREHKQATLQSYGAKRMCLGHKRGSGGMSTSLSSLREAGVHPTDLLPAIICLNPYQEISCLSLVDEHAFKRCQQTG